MLSIGASIEGLVSFLTSRYADVFGAFSQSLNSELEKLIAGILKAPSWSVILLFCLASFLVRRNFKLVVFTGLGLSLIDSMGYWQPMVETLTLLVIATLFSTVLGVPLGIAAARRPRFYEGLRTVLDMMQTIPTFVYLIPTLMFFGLGLVPGLISTIVFVLPVPIRASYLGMLAVPAHLKEVGSAFGANSWQSLLKVELPYARSTIILGINQCLMLSLSMVVIAALVGADGLGKPVLQALNTVNVGKGFEAGLVIVILAIILDRSFIVHHKEQQG